MFSLPIENAEPGRMGHWKMTSYCLRLVSWMSFDEHIIIRKITIISVILNISFMTVHWSSYLYSEKIKIISSS